MNSSIEKAKRLRARAKVLRKRGDALRKAGREEDANDAFMEGLKLLKDTAGTLKPLDPQQIAEDLAETLGAKGGMLRRLGDEQQDEALQAYEEGAEIEEVYRLSSTYNRLNAIKFRLLTGREELQTLKPRLKDLADMIEKTLRIDTKLSDSGWAWADLGDCRALIGDLEAAREAYMTYIDKADDKSPVTTLMVLNELAVAMAKEKDPGAESVRMAAKTLRNELLGMGTTV